MGNVITIGTFDGVHRGHKILLEKITVLSRFLKGKGTVITFKTPPKLITKKNVPRDFLVTLEEKIKQIKKTGKYKVVILEFNERLKNTKPEEFIKILLARFKPIGIVIGANFRFGRKRKGDVKLLKKIAETHNVILEIVPLLKEGKSVISSSVIRRFIRDGNIEIANKLLGYKYYIQGETIRGKGLGKKLGFPTLNLKIPKGKLLPKGVYRVNSFIENKRYQGLCNIGTNPTAHWAGKKLSIELHIINFKDSIKNFKNRKIKIEFVKKVRDEKKFSSLDDLSHQIKSDIDRTFSI